jgi:hypothetical protein
MCLVGEQVSCRASAWHTAAWHAPIAAFVGYQPGSNALGRTEAGRRRAGGQAAARQLAGSHPPSA